MYNTVTVINYARHTARILNNFELMRKSMWQFHLLKGRIPLFNKLVTMRQIIHAPANQFMKQSAGYYVMHLLVN